MSIENLYSTPILVKVLDNHKDINYEIDREIETVNWHTNEKWNTKSHRLNNISTSDFSDDIISSKNLFSLSDTIHECLKEYCNDIDFEMTDYSRSSWILKLNTGHLSHSHNHAPTDISGVYYYKTTGNDGHLFFESPNNYFETSKCFKKKYGQRFLQQPEVGKIILFPGWLRHGVFLNSTDNERVSISFNINFKL